MGIHAANFYYIVCEQNREGGNPAFHRRNYEQFIKTDLISLGNYNFVPRKPLLKTSNSQ